MDACSTCYPLSITECENITLAGLTADTLYYWKITDKFSNEYTGSDTSNGSGVLEIDIDDLPDFLLNKNAGAFTLTLATDADYVNEVEFTYNEVDYDCVLLTVAPQSFTYTWDLTDVLGLSAPQFSGAVKTIDINGNTVTIAAGGITQYVEALNNLFGLGADVFILTGVNLSVSSIANVYGEINFSPYLVDIAPTIT